MIDLSPFFDPNEYRSGLAAPFSDERYTYATNGDIVVRVPLRADVPASKFAPKCDKLFEEQATDSSREWCPIPDDLPDPIMDPCPECEHGCSECVNGYLEQFKSVDVGNSYFARKYLALLKTLPSCTISPNGKQAAWFKFDGGDGLLMPMRERT